MLHNDIITAYTASPGGLGCASPRTACKINLLLMMYYGCMCAGACVGDTRAHRCGVQAVAIMDGTAMKYTIVLYTITIL